MKVYVVVLFCLGRLVTAAKVEECKWTAKGLKYRGTVDKTLSGLTCQRWKSQSPHIHSHTTLEKNYCRNPSGTDPDVWCYTTSAAKRWELCAVPFCSPVADHWLPLQRGRISGVKLTKLSVSSKSLWIVDANFKSYVMHDDQGFTYVQGEINDLSVNEDNGLWMTTTSEHIWYRTGITDSNPAGTSHSQTDGAGTGITTGRRGVMIALARNLGGHDRKGITTSLPMGSSWFHSVGAGFDQMSCGFRQCAATLTNGLMTVTSRFAETDSPTIGSWHNDIYRNITEVAAYGESTLWVVDKNDMALQAINLQDNNFINANWEPRGYHDSVKANFMQMSVTDELAFGMTKGDGDIYVLTGCPIFDFETLSYPQNFWVKTGDAPKYQPSHGTNHTSGALVGKVGNYLIDTGSKNGLLDSESDNGSKDGAITGTIILPEFEIYKDTLHFLVGGGPKATNYVALLIDDEEKRTASGGSKIFEAFGKKYTMARMWWDVTEFKGQCAKVKIVDTSAEVSNDWGFTMFDDLRSAPPCYRGMNIRVPYIPSDKVITVGYQYTFQLDLNGFYVSPHHPLVIEATLNMQNGHPLMYFKGSYCYWTKTTCKNGHRSIEAESKFRNTPGGYPYQLKLEILQLSQNATYSLVVKIWDHKDLIAPSVNTLTSILTITASQGEFFMAKETRHLKLRRTGKEKAIIKQINFVVGGIKNYTVGESFILKVQFFHEQWITHERAYNILTRLQLPPYLSLVSVAGLQNDKGDILYNATTSEKVIKVKEFLFQHERKFLFTIKVIGNPYWNVRDDKMLDGSFILDLTYCIRKNCRDVDDKQIEITSLIQNETYSFMYHYKHSKPVKSMEGFTTIVDKTGSLTFICGPYEQLSRKVRHNCYYNNASAATWKGLSPFLTNISFYDSANKELYGNNKKGVNMKFYGDSFERHYCLSDEDWNTITASSASFSTPLTVNGLLNATANGIDGVLSGGNGYQHAVNGNGGMSRDSVSSPWKAKSKWRCCL